jgi:hypothetical protein
MTPRSIGVLALVMVTASVAGAQMPAIDTAAKRKAMEKLSFLVGDWGGEATAMVGRGQQVRVYQTEWVRPKAMGQVIAVEGLGRRLTPGGLTDTLFNAFAVIDWSAERGYFMRSNVADGRYGEFPLTVTDNGFVWGFELPNMPGARVRYTMTLANGEWNEKGEFSRDGTQWLPTMEMRLKKNPTEKPTP